MNLNHKKHIHLVGVFVRFGLHLVQFSFHVNYCRIPLLHLQGNQIVIIRLNEIVTLHASTEK